MSKYLTKRGVKFYAIKRNDSGSGHPHPYDPIRTRLVHSAGKLLCRKRAGHERPVFDRACAGDRGRRAFLYSTQPADAASGGGGDPGVSGDRGQYPRPSEPLGHSRGVSEAVRICHCQHSLPHVPGEDGSSSQHRHLFGDFEESLCGHHRPCG